MDKRTSRSLIKDVARQRMSQQRLAMACGVHRVNLNRWLSCDIEFSARTVASLRRALPGIPDEVWLAAILGEEVQHDAQ
jgi:DNA-binding transcriptional regulator YdaS (Cro superfamily)